MTLPRSLRTSMWAEHLGLPQDDPRLSDLSGAVDLWAERVGAPDSRIRPHVPPALSRRARLWARTAYRTLCDPDGRPRRLRGSTSF